MARILNSHFILIGGVGITSWAIFEGLGLSLAEIVIFFGVCLILSYAFPHNLDAVKDSEAKKIEKKANKAERFSFKKMQKKLKTEIEEQYGNDPNDD